MDLSSIYHTDYIGGEEHGGERRGLEERVQHRIAGTQGLMGGIARRDIKGTRRYDEASLCLSRAADYSQVDILGRRNKSVIFGEEKSPGSPNW